ncbi:hypothetical protein THAOC_05327 [Thalassiosira oceanica]|uniref:MPN domain-containing protein n=1 Tax=Thalassiosira oceanica TaxID=159749 RepID=K0T320_THAOC|nr:hypothetical protein THAOC_05327 [Thalassiosira oceanica]|mmetsp:Transcript_20519/g.48196  ORF Transcript_20519/g.48196 Transcript_20519/m.48196 type:complete len:234 (-) Transcript_20519:192-893(-)|eukprot:EJK73068.1 hypothetical protein THAOC_05327 [Thalassiosira oceanica]
MSSSISLSTVSQSKMALHAAKHGHGNPIHGILVGRSSSPTSPASSLEVTDAVPVCHEDPTKPIVDMSLRLVDGHLSVKNDGTRIVGWYTSNSNAGDEGPSPSARRVASCLSAEEGGGGGGCVLLAVSAGRIAGCLAGECPGPICDAYEADGKSGAYTRLVDGTRVASEDDGARLGEVIRSAIRSSGEGEGDAAAGGGGSQLSICDFVDHLEDCGRGDWIENREVGRFVKNALA